MSLLRRIIFYIFFAVFIVCTPLIIFYALGYWFYPSKPEGIIKTGLIYLSAVPQNSMVYLGGRKYKEKTPTMISDLVPGNYDVKVVRDHYETWSRQVSVLPGKASVFDKVILIPRDVKREVVLPERFEKLIPLTGHGGFLLAKSGKMNDLKIYSWKNEEIKEFNLSSLGIHEEAEIENYYWIPESSYFVLALGGKDQRQYFGITVKSNDIEARNLSPLFITEPSLLAWGPDDERYLFSYAHGALDRVDAESGMVSPGFIKDVWGFGIFHRDIYILTRHGRFLESGIEDKRSKLLFQDKEFFQWLLGATNFYQVYFLKKNIILLLGDDGKLVGNKPPYHYAGSGIRGMALSEKRQNVAVFDKGRIGILDFSKREIPSELFERGPQIQWIFVAGENIKQIYWLFEDSHLLFVDESGIYLKEILPDGSGSTRFLATIKKDSSICYLEEVGKIYYLADATGYLMSIEILPKAEILFLPFPDLELEKVQKEPSS